MIKEIKIEKFLKHMHIIILRKLLKKGTLKVGDEIEIKPGILEKQANQMVYKEIKTKIVFRFLHYVKNQTTKS